MKRICGRKRVWLLYQTCQRVSFGTINQREILDLKTHKEMNMNSKTPPEKEAKSTESLLKTEPQSMLHKHDKNTLSRSQPVLLFPRSQLSHGGVSHLSCPITADTAVKLSNKSVSLRCSAPPADRPFLWDKAALRKPRLHIFCSASVDSNSYDPLNLQKKKHDRINMSLLIISQG